MVLFLGFVLLHRMLHFLNYLETQGFAMIFCKIMMIVSMVPCPTAIHEQLCTADSPLS